MMRRAFMFLSLVSLVLCMAACAMWVRSYGVADQWSRATKDDQWTARFEKGRGMFSQETAGNGPPLWLGAQLIGLNQST